MDRSGVNGTIEDGFADEGGRESRQLLPVANGWTRYEDKDTKRVRLWRSTLALVLLVAAILVTWVTYRQLVREQFRNCEEAVSENLAPSMFN